MLQQFNYRSKRKMEASKNKMNQLHDGMNLLIKYFFIPLSHHEHRSIYDWSGNGILLHLCPPYTLSRSAAHTFPDNHGHHHGCMDCMVCQGLADNLPWHVQKGSVRMDIYR